MSAAGRTVRARRVNARFRPARVRWPRWLLPALTGRGPLPPGRLDAWERRAVGWMCAHSLFVLRTALGVVYVWFGVLKFFPGRSPAEHLAGETMSAITAHSVPQSVSLPLLGAMESLIGAGLLLGRFLRPVLLLMAVQMTGTFLPLVLFPGQTWRTAGVVPDMEGQYIIKNLVLIGGGLVVGATVRGGRPFDTDRSAVERAGPPRGARRAAGPPVFDEFSQAGGSR